MVEQIAPPKNIEDRLADKIKNSDLGAFFGEDDLSDVIKKAIDKAFFQNRPDSRGYGNTVEPRIVEMAKDKFEAAINAAAAPLAAEIVNSEHFHEILSKAIMARIPAVAERVGYALVTDAIMQHSQSAHDELAHALTTKLQAIRASGAMG